MKVIKMPWFRKKPVIIFAEQWLPQTGGCGVTSFYTTTPDRVCDQCGFRLGDHGSIPTLEGMYIACPGDWIVTGAVGDKYPHKPDIFAKTYEEVEAPL